jgi:hypothetical protein
MRIMMSYVLSLAYVPVICSTHAHHRVLSLAYVPVICSTHAHHGELRSHPGLVDTILFDRDRCYFLDLCQLTHVIMTRMIFHHTTFLLTRHPPIRS